jgi:DNA-binding response OmpR family regulator
MKHQEIKIMVVEDDEIACENAIEYLSTSFCHVLEASNGLEAWQLYCQHKPHIIITDIMMPKINGLELVQRIRQNDKTTQVIITSAHSSKEYLLKAIELRLVKYLIKPIVQSELDEALKQCCDFFLEEKNNIITLFDNTCFDLFNKTIQKEGEIIHLRSKESLLLELLVKNRSHVVSYEEIERTVWQDNPMSKDALKTVIRDLKKKLDCNCFKNLSGVGYKFEF